MPKLKPENIHASDIYGFGKVLYLLSPSDFKCHKLNSFFGEEASHKLLLNSIASVIF